MDGLELEVARIPATRSQRLSISSITTTGTTYASTTDTSTSTSASTSTTRTRSNASRRRPHRCVVLVAVVVTRHGKTLRGTKPGARLEHGEHTSGIGDAGIRHDLAMRGLRVANKFDREAYAVRQSHQLQQHLDGAKRRAPASQATPVDVERGCEHCPPAYTYVDGVASTYGVACLVQVLTELIHVLLLNVLHAFVVHGFDALPNLTVPLIVRLEPKSGVEANHAQQRPTT